MREAIGSIDVTEPGNLSITNLQAPAEVNIDESLTPDYVVENVGSRAETGVVPLSVDSETAPQDSDKVTLGPGEATGGALTYDNGRVEPYPPALGGLDTRSQDLSGDGDGVLTIFDVQGVVTSLDATGQFPVAFNFDVQAFFVDLAD